VEEMNLEKNDEQNGRYMKEKSFQYIVDESKILEVVGNKERDERTLQLKTLYPIKDNNILEQPRIDFIELWFQSIVGQAMQSNFVCIQFNFSPVHIEIILCAFSSTFLQYILKVPLKIGTSPMLRKRYEEPYSSIFRSCWAKER
jgi:hypothetical protein